MTERSVNKFPVLINQQFKTQEALFERLSQANALASIALSEGFLNEERYRIHNYLWVLSELIEEAKEFSEQLINHSFC